MGIIGVPVLIATPTIDTQDLAVPAPSRRALLAACVGNVVEWYDFAIFGALGVVLVPVFFPSGDGSRNLLAAFAVFATAFLARPLGAVFWGRRGDARGRQGVLASVVLAMTAATVAIGLVPSHARIGVAASLAVVLLRITQGLAAGGELGLAAVFIAEHAAPARRGLVASWHTATLAAGVALGFGMGALVLALAPDDGRAGWWRIPFLVALPLGLAGVYVRRRVAESPVFRQPREVDGRGAHPVREVWRERRPALRAGFALIAAGSLAFNTWFVFLPNHLVDTTARSLPSALLASVGGLLVSAVAAVALGRLSDRAGRRPVVLGSLGALGLSVVPLWLLATSGSFAALVTAQAVAGVAIAGVLSVALLAELFPTRLRATGLALTAGLATAALGGTAPLVGQILFKVTGLEIAPALYVALAALIALVAMSGQPETASSDLATR